MDGAFNPYQPPSSSGEFRSHEFYAPDIRGLTYGECRRAVGNIVQFLILALLKLLGFRSSLVSAFSTQLEWRSWNELPSDLQTRTTESAGELLQAGYECVGVCRRNVIGCLDAVATIYRAPDGRDLAVVSLIRAWPRMRLQTFVRASLFSQTADGQTLVTSNALTAFPHPPNVVVERQGSWTVRQLLERHAAKLASSPVSIVPYETPEATHQAWEDYERQTWDYLVERRVLTPITDEQVEALRGNSRVPHPSRWHAVARYANYVTLGAFASLVFFSLAGDLSIFGLIACAYAVLLVAQSFQWWVRRQMR